jgi:hypothetical protein
MTIYEDNWTNRIFYGVSSILILVASNGYLGYNLLRQSRASFFQTVTGKMIINEVTTNYSNRGGSSFEANLRYVYTVDGENYEGHIWRHGLMPTDYPSNKALVDTLRAGGAPIVYYNPRDPADSLLSPGIVGSDLLAPLVLIPFDLLVLVVVLVPIWQWTRWNVPYAVAGGENWRIAERRYRVHLPQRSPAAYGLIAIDITAWPAALAAYLADQGDPSLPRMLVTWVVVLGSGAAAGGWVAARQSGGRADLVIDDRAGTIVLPCTFGRTKTVILRQSDVQDVVIAETVKSRFGHSESSYEVTFVRSDGTRDQLTAWHDEERARTLTGWLARRLNPPASQG